MEKERIFVAFASVDKDGDLQTTSARVTQEQLELLYWLYNNDLLNGKFEEDDPSRVVIIAEP